MSQQILVELNELYKTPYKSPLYPLDLKSSRKNKKIIFIDFFIYFRFIYNSSTNINDTIQIYMGFCRTQQDLQNALLYDPLSFILNFLMPIFSLKNSYILENFGKIFI